MIDLYRIGMQSFVISAFSLLMIHVLHGLQCPTNRQLWTKRAGHFMCNGNEYYHCLYEKNDPEEFCAPVVIIRENRCASYNRLTDVGNISYTIVVVNCSGNGCPDGPYLSNETYKYLNCNSRFIKSTISQKTEGRNVQYIPRFVSLIEMSVNETYSESTQVYTYGTDGVVFPRGTTKSFDEGQLTKTMHLYIIIGTGIVVLFLMNVCCFLIRKRRKRGVQGNEDINLELSGIDSSIRSVHPVYDESWELNSPFRDVENSAIYHESRDVCSSCTEREDINISIYDESCEMQYLSQNRNIVGHFENSRYHHASTAEIIKNSTFQNEDNDDNYTNSVANDDCQSVYVYNHLIRGTDTLQSNPTDDNF